MKRPLVALLVVVGLALWLSACGSGEPVDYEAVEAVLTTKPETIAAGSPVELAVSFTGMKVTGKATVTFDVRVGEKPVLFDAVHQGEGSFSGSFTFPEKGSYAVYIHLYVDDLHLTKKKTVEVS